MLYLEKFVQVVGLAGAPVRIASQPQVVPLQMPAQQIRLDHFNIVEVEIEFCKVDRKIASRDDGNFIMRQVKLDNPGKIGGHFVRAGDGSDVIVAHVENDFFSVKSERNKVRKFGQILMRTIDPNLSSRAGNVGASTSTRAIVLEQVGRKGANQIADFDITDQRFVQLFRSGTFKVRTLQYKFWSSRCRPCGPLPPHE